MTIEARYRPFRMFVRRTIDLRFDPKPITDSGNLTEWHAGLRHPEGPGIHAEKQNAFRIVSVTAKINFVGAPGVAQRVVNVRDWRGEGQRVDGVAQSSSGRDQISRHTSISSDRCNGCRSRRAARFR